jgi:hypothetical protein
MLAVFYLFIFNTLNSLESHIINRRFKSAFIFFSTEKHKEIRNNLGEEGSKIKVSAIAMTI